MNELLKNFLDAAADDTKVLSVEELMTEDERIEWETLVKALDSIDVMNVGRDLEKVTKMFTLTRWQEMSILAYIKILELMRMRAKETGVLDGVVTPSMNPSDTSYTGSMFG